MNQENIKTNGMKKPHFLLSNITFVDRTYHQDEPIRDGPDYTGYPGEVLQEGLKSEKLILQITLDSSGNTSELSTKQVVAGLMFLLGGEIN